MLAEASLEPVLAQIAASISADEVRHYKHFYRFFRKYRDLERPSRGAVLRTLLSRAAEIDAEDAFYAFRHVFLTCGPGVVFCRSDYVAFRAGLRGLASRHFAQEMAIKMLLA